MAIHAQDERAGARVTTDISPTSPTPETTLPHGLGLRPDQKKRNAEARGEFVFAENARYCEIS